MLLGSLASCDSQRWTLPSLLMPPPSMDATPPPCLEALALSSVSVPAMVLRTPQAPSHSVFPAMRCCGGSSYPHFTDGETETETNSHRTDIKLRQVRIQGPSRHLLTAFSMHLPVQSLSPFPLKSAETDECPKQPTSPSSLPQQKFKNYKNSIHLNSMHGLLLQLHSVWESDFIPGFLLPPSSNRYRQIRNERRS